MTGYIVLDIIIYALVFVNVLVLIEGIISSLMIRLSIFECFLNRLLRADKITLARIVALCCIFGYGIYILLTLARKRFVCWCLRRAGRDIPNT